MYSNVTVSQPQIDGSKVVTINDVKNNNQRSVKVSADEADKFVSIRDELIKTLEKRRKKSLIYMPIGCGAISAVGSLFNKEWIKQFGKMKTVGIQGLMGCAAGFALAAIVQSKKSLQRGVENLDNAFINKHS